MITSFPYKMMLGSKAFVPSDTGLLRTAWYHKIAIRSLFDMKDLWITVSGTNAPEMRTRAKMQMTARDI